MVTVSEIRQDFQERGSKLNIMIYLLERIPIMQWLLGLKKIELSRSPRYINTRVADIYPITKPADRIKILSSKDRLKDAPLFQKHIKEINQNSTLSDVKLSSKFIWRRNENHT